MSSKYANLPDIDTAPDVYETEDVVPERIEYVDETDDDPTRPASARALQKKKEEEERERPDESPLPGFDLAGAKFGALAAKTYSLYPPLQSRQNPTLPAPSLPHDINRSALLSTDTEPPRARLRRLRYEMNELEEQLVAQASSPVDPDDESKEREVGDMMRELKGLMGGLAQLDGKGNQLEIDAKGKGWGDRLKDLGKRSEGVADGQEDRLIVQTSGTSAGEVEEKRKLAELDRRLAELEGAVGIGRVGLDDSQTLPTPLLPTLQKLDHLLTLLTQPRHLDAISRRIKLLLSDLDRAQTATKPSHPSSEPKHRPSNAHAEPSSVSGSSSLLTGPQTQKIDSLFTLLPKIQPLLPLVPHLLTRLHSLADLHTAAASFGSTLSGLEREGVRAREAEKELREVVGRMEESLKANEERIEGNLQAVGERVEDVVRRVQAL